MKGTYQDHSQWIIPFWILILIPQTYSCLKPLLAENQVSLWPILGSFCGKPQANQTEPRNPRSTSTMIGINANWTNLILWCITYISILHGKKRGEQKHINSWKVSDSSPKGYGAPKAMGIFTLVFFSCLKGLLGVWLSSRFVYMYIYIYQKKNSLKMLGVWWVCLVSVAVFQRFMDRTSSPMFLSPMEKTMPGRVKDQLIAE